MHFNTGSSLCFFFHQYNVIQYIKTVKISFFSSEKQFTVCFYHLSLFVWRQTLLSCPGWLWTHCSATASWVLWLQTCTSNPAHIFFTFHYFLAILLASISYTFNMGAQAFKGLVVFLLDIFKQGHTPIKYKMERKSWTDSGFGSW